MPSRKWSDDDQLMRDLAEALRPNPMEQLVVDAARTAYAWRTADADLELAALLYDSYLDQAATVRGRQPGSPRTLVFGRGSLRVEIELTDTGIEGQLIPPEPGVVRLLTVTGPGTETTADEVGCFAFPTQRGQPIRLECTLDGDRIITDWITT